MGLVVGSTFYRHYRVTDGDKTKQTVKHLAVLSGTDKKKDFEQLHKAMMYRDEYEKALNSPDNQKCNILIIDYINHIKKSYPSKKTQSAFQQLAHHIEKSDSNTTLGLIDKSFCLKFVDYLKANNLKSNNYFYGKLKNVVGRAVADGLIPENSFFRRVKFKQPEPAIKFMTIDEVRQLIEAPTKYPEFKKALIFAIYTGLRFVDIFKLEFKDIVDGKINIKQQKTNVPLSIKLHPTALEIIESQPIGKRIFEITSYEVWRRNVKKIYAEAGLSDKLTGHCARHTFATMLITNDVDLYTVSKLLGHTSINHTQKYAKVVDKKKDEAIDKLPKI